MKGSRMALILKLIRTGTSSAKGDVFDTRLGRLEELRDRPIAARRRR